MESREVFEKCKKFCDKAKRHPKFWIGFGILLAVILLIWLPPWQVSHFEIYNPKIEADLENQYRATLAQILGGVAIGITLYYTWRRITIAEEDLKATQENLAIAQENLKVSQEGQITERFTRAIDQFGNEKMEILLGGIYALERIANESEKDYWPIMEILTAYVRKNSPVELAESQDKVSLDIQTILSAIRRRKNNLNSGEPFPLDLQSTYLQNGDIHGANLSGANFIGASLSNANLSDTNLSKANLIKAKLPYAHLKRANLSNAHLSNADLSGANLSDADLSGANLSDTDLSGANLSDARLSVTILEGTNLSGAYLSGAYLSGAYLSGAHLSGAHLSGAHLSGADLSGADLSGADFIGANLSDADLSGADLSGAHLSVTILEGTNLKGANLIDANLGDAKDLTFGFDQLSKVKTLYNAKLDEELLIPLKKNYPALFEEPNE